ncbi:LysM peptidoglycan-binding domain-containing protein [Nocardioides aurantiacus]|uniref:LysM domain-containing protein n=1 Tax=Nocardioides aurantiacus TaxID=86796 RepID=A0A3N2CRF1_9ACTN|nr:LysM peptidoglycan-binding domain-containing protein [Nocardioides aurantiacus]ROR90122.1 LysM domain-containing protein [Nocardioides aurantiacus]
MSTLSIARETTRTSAAARVRVPRPRASAPTFDFTAPVTALGQEDPALQVLEVPSTVRTVAPLAAPAPQRQSRAVRQVRLTRRGRLTLTLLFLGVVLTAMVAVGGSWAVASLGGGEPVPVRVVEVQPGDTLYGIASSVAEPGEVREMVYEIQELNSLPTATIAEGQKLAVPRG